MKAPTNIFLDSMLEALFGASPAAVSRVLAAFPNMRARLEDPARSICARSVPCWDDLGAEVHTLRWPRRQRGHLIGWTASGSAWHSFQIVRPEFEKIARVQTGPITVDLQDVDGFACSKSDLTQFTSTDELVEANSRELIAQVSEQQLAKRLAHREVRIIHAPGTDFFARYQWDTPVPRLWVMNSGGSHNLSAAKYIAARLSQRVALTGMLRTYSLDAGAVASLLADFEMFALADDDLGSAAFHDAMKAVRATWLTLPLPKPYESCRAVLLPRSEGRSMRVAQELRSAGVADLGAHLAVLADRGFHGDGRTVSG